MDKSSYTHVDDDNDDDVFVPEKMDGNQKSKNKE